MIYPGSVENYNFQKYFEDFEIEIDKLLEREWVQGETRSFNSDMNIYSSNQSANKYILEKYKEAGWLVELVVDTDGLCYLIFKNPILDS